MTKTLRLMVAVPLLMIFLLAFAQNSFAQYQDADYATAIGFKFSPVAATVKHFVQDYQAVEVLGYFYYDGFRFTALYEWYGDIGLLDGLKWYAGGGVHLDFWEKGSSYRRDGNSSVAPGIDGVVGMDYKFYGAPVNISLDWQPSLNFATGDVFASNWVGVGLRFAF